MVVVGVLVVSYFRNLPESPSPEVSGDVSLSGIANEDGTVTGGEIHQIQAGETLWEVSEEYYGTGYDWTKIAQENDIANPDDIEEGQELIIPSPAPQATPKPEQPEEQAPTNLTAGETYTVVHRDTLWSIAEAAYGDPYRWIDIANANNLTNPNIIHAGNTFTIPE